LRRTLFCLVLCLGIAFRSAGPCSAHPFNNGYTYIHLHENTADVRLLLPFLVMLQYDTNHNQAISDDELKAQQEEISAYMESHLQLFGNLRPMTYSLTGLKSIIQEETEDPMVELDFHFQSDSPIDKLDVVYDVVLADVDPDHQNFIQIFDGQGKVALQQVVDKYAHKLEYVNGGEVRFPVDFLALIAVLGVQQAVKNSALLLFAAWLCIQPVRLRALLKTALVFAAAGLLGSILSFRSGFELPQPWAEWFGIALVLSLAAAMLLRRNASGHRFAAALLGGAQGLAAFRSVMEAGVPGEYKMIFLAVFHLGMLLALTGMVYVLYTLAAVLRGKVGNRKKENGIG